MIDSGCGHDLVPEAEARKHMTGQLHLGAPIMFRTASGCINTRNKVTVKIAEFEQDAEPYVLPDSPAVLSLGRRCREGFAFVWQAYDKPYFVRPDGMIIQLDVINDIPYLTPTALRCQPVPASSEVSIPHHYAAPAPSDGKGRREDEGRNVSAPRGADDNGIGIPSALRSAREPGDLPPLALECEVVDPHRPLREDACSLTHRLTHKPKSPYCDICTRTRSRQV